MLRTEAGICISVSFEQEWKALLPIVLRFGDSLTEVRLLQRSNADEPILVILSDRLIDDRLLQEENAYEPILVTLSGMLISRK